MTTEHPPAEGPPPEWYLTTAPLAGPTLAYAVEMPELAELDALIRPGFGGVFAVDGESGSGRSTLLSLIAARREAITARVLVHREMSLIEVEQQVILDLSRSALAYVEALPHTPAPQGWHDKAKAQLFAPMYWTARGLRALSVSLFSLVAIAFILVQIAPDLFERPAGALAGVIGDILGRPPVWVWVAVAVAGIAIWISLRLQRRLDRQVDEAVGDLSGWIPNDRVRTWLGVDPETDVDSLGETAKRLAQSVTSAQQVRVARGGNAFAASMGLLRLQGSDEGEAGARVASLGGATEELAGIIQQIAKVSRTLIILEGPGAAGAGSAFSFTAGLPACDVLVEGNPGNADARVLIGDWNGDRLFEVLVRRAPAGVDAPEWAARGAADSAGGNPREAIRRFRLALTAAGILEPT